MTPLHKTITIDAAGKATLSGLPFRDQEVDVIIIPRRTAESGSELDALFSKSQQIATQHNISESDIAREIAEYRRS